jgi:hypothetical protein
MVAGPISEVRSTAALVKIQHGTRAWAGFMTMVATDMRFSANTVSASFSDSLDDRLAAARLAAYIPVPSFGFRQSNPQESAFSQVIDP